jgi:hypothetical protein
MVMALNATFNNISVMSRRSVLSLVPRMSGENYDLPQASEYIHLKANEGSNEFGRNIKNLPSLYK